MWEYDKSFKRFDVVVLNYNNDKLIKRIIGLPGENVKYLNGLLYINDKPFRETFLSDDVVTNNFMFEDICNNIDCPDGVIPKNKYLVLGDNRIASEDSRSPSFGLIDKKEIKGKVFFKIFPFNNMGRVN